jgi:molybdenum cofactor cytidylyltransferase
VAGVVLAAGTSSRLGAPKQLLELEGKPLLQHVVDVIAASGLDETVIVLGHAAEEVADRISLPPRARVVVNADYARGMASSLAAGVDAVDPDSDAAVVVLGDQPRLTRAHVRRAVQAFARGQAPIVRALFGDVPGHPIVVARSHWHLLRAATGDKGARDVLASHADVVDHIDLGAPLDDVDTWEDYESLRAPVRAEKSSGAEPPRL